MTKLLLYDIGNPDKARIFLLALTAVVDAINVHGAITHSVLHIPCHVKLLALSDTNRLLQRNKYSEVQLFNNPLTYGVD